MRHAGVCLVVLIGAVPRLASAHIHLTNPLAHTDAGLGDQKEQHCGTPTWVRADHPERTTVLPAGGTIMVTWMETINHSGHFRIAFQPDGLEFGIPPVGAGAGGFPDVNQEGMTLGDGTVVLADFIADGTLSKEVTLPDVTCTNCTLQFIQVMYDNPPYTTDAMSNDIYFNCADVTLTRNVPDASVPPPAPDAAPQNPGDPDAGIVGEGPITGGCDVAGTSGILTLLAAVGLTRRRRTAH